MAPRAVGAEKVIEPVKMREIGRENAENFQLKPAHPQDNGHQANRQKHTGGKAVDIVLTERHGEIAQQKSQTGDELRAIPQRVQRHGHGDD